MKGKLQLTLAARSSSLQAAVNLSITAMDLSYGLAQGWHDVRWLGYQSGPVCYSGGDRCIKVRC